VLEDKRTIGGLKMKTLADVLDIYDSKQTYSVEVIGGRSYKGTVHTIEGFIILRTTAYKGHFIIPHSSIIHIHPLEDKE
jgi:hypothetical protein